MRFLVAATLLTLLVSTVWGQTVAELTIQSSEGTLINLYDSPVEVLERVDIPGEMPSSGPNWDQYSSDDLTVRAIRQSLPDGETVYALYNIEVRQGWETIRGIGVGSGIEDVAAAYPDIKFYVPGENVEWDYAPGARVPEGLVGSMYWDYGPMKRVTDWDYPLIYGFLFFLDEDGVVNRFQMDYIVTEA